MAHANKQQMDLMADIIRTAGVEVQLSLKVSLDLQLFIFLIIFRLLSNVHCKSIGHSNDAPVTHPCITLFPISNCF